MSNAWGKVANNMRVVGLFSVDVHPHIYIHPTIWLYKSVYNYLFLPTLPAFFTRRFPQDFLPILPLLSSFFSPLSTLPITITTNLKFKER